MNKELIDTIGSLNLTQGLQAITLIWIAFIFTIWFSNHRTSKDASISQSTFHLRTFVGTVVKKVKIAHSNSSHGDLGPALIVSNGNEQHFVTCDYGYTIDNFTIGQQVLVRQSSPDHSVGRPLENL